MKKIFYAAMLLLGLSIFLTACNNSGTSKGDSQANTSVEKEKTNNPRSSASIEKTWKKAMEANGHLFFRTPYTREETPIYMMMIPYVFSKDGTRGVIYAVYYYERGASYWIGLDWYAQYEIKGEHLLLTDITLNNENYNTEPLPRIMGIEHNNGRFVIKGRYPTWKKNDLTPVESFYQESNPSHSDSYLELAEGDRYCMHK